MVCAVYPPPQERVSGGVCMIFLPQPFPFHLQVYPKQLLAPRQFHDGG